MNDDEQTKGTGINFGISGDGGSSSAKRVYLYSLFIASSEAADVIPAFTPLLKASATRFGAIRAATATEAAATAGTVPLGFTVGQQEARITARTGVASGDIPLLGTGGTLAEARIPTLDIATKTRGNLNATRVSGLGTAASVDTGDSTGDVVLLDSNARIPPARLGSGTADNTKFLDGSGAWVDAPEPGALYGTPTVVEWPFDSGLTSFSTGDKVYWWDSGWTLPSGAGNNDLISVAIVAGTELTSTTYTESYLLPVIQIHVGDWRTLTAKSNGDTANQEGEAVVFPVIRALGNNDLQHFGIGRTSDNKLLWTTSTQIVHPVKMTITLIEV